VYFIRFLSKMEKVDILTIPTFEKSGVIKTREQAYKDGDRIGSFNLRILQNGTQNYSASIIYQVRSPKVSREPWKLDTSAAGHLQAGESYLDGLREVEEELGKTYKADQVKYLGRKLNLSYDTI